MTAAPRKLATIVALDVAGYSARTEADEAKTTAEVAALRKVIEEIAKTHGGRVFNTAGDGFMLEFASSLAAVEAASELAAKCEPKVRVGVHLGDVVVQPNGDLLGHGVNVAARLMAKSDPGGALISADVRRTIRGPLAERLVSRGLMQLDKMAETIEAFALGESAAAITGVQSQPSEPTLVVLPFDNLSNDPEMQYFSDGMSEEILQVLARGSGLRVIGRTSAFQFRGSRKGEAARMLRASHVLDGAVRKAGARLRVSAQLTEAAGGAALWSEQYDEDLTDVFTVQDNVAAKVASSLRAVLEAAPRDRKIDPRAYELYLKALEERTPATDEGHRRAELLLEEAVALAPDFTDGWAWLAGMRVLQLPRDRDCIGAPQHNAALAAARRAQTLDPKCALANVVLANLKPAFAEHAEKINLVRRAEELAPNDPVPPTYMGRLLVAVGRCKDASVPVLKAATLDPMNPLRAASAAHVLEAMEQAEVARIRLDEAIKAQPANVWTASAKFMHFFNASRFAEAGEHLDASILARVADLNRLFRSLLMVVSASQGRHDTRVEELFEPTDGALDLVLCQAAARFGWADLAFNRLFAALDGGRPITAWASSALHLSRATMLNAVFGADGKAFRADRRFAAFCARVSLVEYWRESGHWPDCTAVVPYDFKAECEKAVRELGKR